MDHDLTPAPEPGAPTAGPPETGTHNPSGPLAGTPSTPPGPARGADPGSGRGGAPRVGRDGGDPGTDRCGAESGGLGPTARGSAGLDAEAEPFSAADPGADRYGADLDGLGPTVRGSARADAEAEPFSAVSPAPGATVRLASPGSVVASIPLLFGFHPDNSLVVLGIGGAAGGGRYIRHGVRIDLDEIRGRERAAALELAARLRDHEAEIAILVAFGPRAATGAKARPDHCRKLMAAFRAQIEAAPTEERVTVVDALYTCNNRWWSYMCRNPRCCPTTGTPVPAEAPPALATAMSTRGHTVYPTREALDATLAPYPPDVLARAAAAVEPLDPAWYDTDAGLASARRLMDSLLVRCGDPAAAPPAAATQAAAASAPAPNRSRTAAAESPRRRGRSVTVAIPDADADADAAATRRIRAAAAEPPRRGGCATHAATEASATRRSRSAAAESSSRRGRSASAGTSRPRAAAAESPRRRGLSVTASIERPPNARALSAEASAKPATASADKAAAAPARRPRVAAAEPPRSTRRGPSVTATATADAAIPAARSAGRRANRVPALGARAEETGAANADAPMISDAEVAQLLIALLNWRVRDYLACAAATEDSAKRLLRLCTELARRAPHPELRLAPYALAAWAAWAIGRPSVAQCAVDRALAIDPEYKFASLIRAGLHHAIDGEGVRESAANTRRDLFGEVVVDFDTDPDAAPAPVPSQRSTESVPQNTNPDTHTDLEVP
ncbi:MAG: DUF4192 family protein [Catenulispora sp.]|nr:DUF4192 family protein [Catenulispora sp.]